MVKKGLVTASRRDGSMPNFCNVIVYLKKTTSSDILVLLPFISPIAIGQRRVSKLLVIASLRDEEFPTSSHHGAVVV